MGNSIAAAAAARSAHMIIANPRVINEKIGKYASIQLSAAAMIIVNSMLCSFFAAGTKMATNML